MRLNLAVERPDLDASDDTDAVPDRPFQVADAMILIAALIFAMAWDRGGLLDPLQRLRALPPGPGGMAWRLATELAQVVERLTPYLTVGSLAVLALRLRSPRPGWRRFIGSPGLVACAMGALGMVPALLTDLITNALSGRPWAIAWARTVEDLAPGNLAGLSAVVGMAVLVAWIAMAATRRWRTEPSWIDRLGRFLGAGWIALSFGGVFLAVVALGRLAG